ncbi:hypothetical protein IGI04_002154 [Brassica rapa subsp. trilocularis]|uniref:RNase H type-1 domain-containing protein n=1 Tax=Brassica rapa subsp. trilocularis TaxID=1813537 RepID=A0ABQ7NUS0_BRACM|nr:hypothetical protein IGI04_002154 [Brassica rapa subsp. trilocularis]
MKSSEKNKRRESWRFGVLKLRITHVLQPLILIGKDCSDQPDPYGGFKSRIFQKPSVISLSSSIVFLSQSHGLKVLLYTHSPDNSRIPVNCSCDTKQGYEDTMMGSHPGCRVTACSIRCSILEYLMEMMVIFISPLGSVSLGGFPGGRPYSRTGRNIISQRFIDRKPRGALVFFGCWSKAIRSIQRTSDRPSKNINRVISGQLRSGCHSAGNINLWALLAQMEGLLLAASYMRDMRIPSIRFKTDCSDPVDMTTSQMDWPTFSSEIQTF